MPPIPSPDLDPQQEEDRRQADTHAGGVILDVLQVAGDGASVVLNGTVGAVVDGAGAVLGATVDVAKASIETVGSLFGALGDL